ncbi:hypothetical protein ACFSL4_01595 [Streptomyces caeni]|uniref:Uncharacterized protein n=1 Tax=Streptomyces caeni TaxID=2307231 RepID=A0ABW4II08_9ACTN
MTGPHLPPGPALLFIGADDGLVHTIHLVDRVPVRDPRDRALCRALLQHALTLVDQAEAADAES